MVWVRGICGSFSASMRWTWLVMAFSPALADAQLVTPAESDQATKMNEVRLAAMKAMASRYELVALIEGHGRRELQRTARPVLRWTNPIRGTLDGSLFLWTLAGRPQAALTIYPTLDGTAWNHEFQSLAITPLVATLGAEAVWTPNRPGLEFKAVPDAQRPGKSATHRRKQMRSLARRFAGTVDVRGDKTTLRLLAAPVYQYGQVEGDPLDGAAFAFAQATDPELLLIIEARMDENEPHWYYALARLTQWPLAATYDSEPVWSVEKWFRGKSHPNQTYFDRIHRKD